MNRRDALRLLLGSTALFFVPKPMLVVTRKFGPGRPPKGPPLTVAMMEEAFDSAAFENAMLGELVRLHEENHLEWVRRFFWELSPHAARPEHRPR